MKTGILVAILAVVLAFGTTQAQTPVVVQAVPTANAPVATQALPVQSAAASQTALQGLQTIKAANEELLKKQAATLLQLEEMEKAAEQIKIYSKRG